MEAKKDWKFPIAVIIVFIVLLLLSFIAPSMIAPETIQSLGFPALLLSIVTSTRLIIRNALILCEKGFNRESADYDKYKEWRDYFNSVISDGKYGDEKYADLMVEIERKTNRHLNVVMRISKFDRVVMYIEIAVIAFFLLSAIIRTSFIYFDEHILVLFTLTVMLFSAYFNTFFADLIFNKLMARAEKAEVAATNDVTKKPQQEEANP